MRITIRGCQPEVRLRRVLDRAAELRCAHHDRAIDAVIVDARANGSFDPIWITCCRSLQQQADAMMDQCA